MLSISFNDDTSRQEFIDRHAGDEAHDAARRDELIVARQKSLADLTYGGEPMGGELWLEVDGERMQAYAGGATVILLELNEAERCITEGAISYQTGINGDYGVALGFDRDGESVEISRKPRRGLGGVDRVRTTVTDLTAAVRAYERWYHTEYILKASWLLLVPDVQELRRQAGYPHNHV